MGAEILAGYGNHYNREARLVLLKALSEQNDYRLNDKMLTTILKTFGFNKDRAYVRNQLKWLEDNASAVKLVDAGTAVVAELLAPGLSHLERTTVLEGVQRPSLAEE
jgi:hypothetical protein